VYVAGELNSSVSLLRCDPQTAALSVAARRSSCVRPDSPARTISADIQRRAHGRALYVSNPGQNSMARVQRRSRHRHAHAHPGRLDGGDWPRNFTLDPTGRWLLVANQLRRGGSIVVFRRDVQSGRLTPTSQRITLASPVSCGSCLDSFSTRPRLRIDNRTPW